MRHGSLFSGIGGFDLAAEWMGWTNVFHCEMDPFCNRVLKHHFPQSIGYENIKETTFSVHRGDIDILTGGFPCQPYSTAGKRLGKQDERHLWPEMLRAIREIEPTYIVGENVRGLLSWNEGVVLNEIYADLEAEGYEVGTFVLPAVGVNAPHKRDRVWIVAYSDNNRHNAKRREEEKERGVQSRERQEMGAGQFDRASVSSSTSDACGIGRRGRDKRSATDQSEEQSLDQNIGQYGYGVWGETSGCGADAANTSGDRLQGGVSADLNKQPSGTGEYDAQYLREGAGSQGIPFEGFPTKPPICGGDDGLSRELDNITFSKWRKESIKAYGNAIVPQVAFQIFKAIASTYE